MLQGSWEHGIRWEKHSPKPGSCLQPPTNQTLYLWCCSFKDTNSWAGAAICSDKLGLGSHHTLHAAFKFRCLQLFFLLTTAVLWHWADGRLGQRVCTPYPVWGSPLPSEDRDGDEDEDVSPAW